MNPKLSEPIPAGTFRSLLAVFTLALPIGLFGQEVAPAPTAAAAPEEIVELSPFVVEASEDAGSYSATASLAGTRLRTNVKDVSSAIQVVTQKFLTDTNSKTAADLLVYTTNTEVAGQGGNFAGLGDGAVLNDGEFIEPVPNTRIRGLASADNLRDFFLTDIPWDSYNVGRVDIQRGPNSVLFGIGSPAGIINSSVNPAAFDDMNKVEVQIASFGTLRGTIDFNKEIMDDELSVRVAGLYDRTKYKQDPAHRDDTRLYGAVRWEPKALAKNGMRTSIRANYETGEIKGTKPRATPPMDAITPWFDLMGMETFPWQDLNTRTTAGLDTYNPFIGAAGQRVWDGQLATFEHNSGNQDLMFGADPQNWPADQPPENNNTTNGQYRGIQTWNQIGKNLRLPGWQISPYKARSLTDTSIFDYENNLLEGENRNNWNDFDAYNINVAQTFLDNKLGFELAYDNQKSDFGYKHFFAWDAAQITVDIMETLVDGSPNPNLGRAMTVGGGGSSGSGHTHRERETFRVTAFGELDFEDMFSEDSGFARFLGRHIFTGNYTQMEIDEQADQWVNWYVGEGFEPTAANAVKQASRDAISLTYLSDSLIGTARQATGLNLPRITAIQEAQSGSVVNWDTVSQSFVTYPVPIVNPNSSEYTETTRPYTDARKTLETIDSTVLVWQGFFWDSAIVPMFAWRQDDAKAYDAGTPAYDLGIVSNYNDPNFRLPEGPDDLEGGRTYNAVSGDTTSWGIVARLPRSMLQDMPWGLDISGFYNESSNFQPDASRKDILGQPLPSPSGETTDYGIMISALQNRVSLKLNWYETSVNNATLSGSLPTSYLIGAGEAWGQAMAVHLKNDDGIWPADGNFGTESNGATLRWEPPTSGLVDPALPFQSNPELENYNPYTQEAIDTRFAEQTGAMNDWLAKPVSAEFQQAWGMSGYAEGSGLWSMNDVFVTGDTLSKGLEIELTAQPVTGWNMSINASQTDAKRLNIGDAYTQWIEQRYEDYQGPMGDILLWGGGNWGIPAGSGGTVRDKFNLETYADYQLALALNNSQVPEMREWRFTFTTNYDFQEGVLRGGNIGGSWRWVDSNVTGFPLNSAQNGYDVDDPYYGAKEGYVDLWAGYQFKIFDEKVNWRIQLNVRNILGQNDLIPITVQPDGTPGTYRIPEPTTFTLTNTFEF